MTDIPRRLRSFLRMHPGVRVVRVWEREGGGRWYVDLEAPRCAVAPAGVERCSLRVMGRTRREALRGLTGIPGAR